MSRSADAPPSRPAGASSRPAGSAAGPRTVAPPKDTPPRGRLAGVTGLLAIVLGSVGLVGFVLGFAFGQPVPDVLRYANLAAAVLELGLGYGLLRRRRAAWSFVVALEATLFIVNLLGLPELLRAGRVGIASVVLAGLRAAFGVAAASAEKEMR